MAPYHQTAQNLMHLTIASRGLVLHQLSGRGTLFSEKEVALLVDDTIPCNTNSIYGLPVHKSTPNIILHRSHYEISSLQIIALLL